MASFSYTAKDKKGSVSKGELYSSDRASAAASLMDQGLVPILIKENLPKKNSPLTSFLKLEAKVKLGDKVVFSRQFATMINAGIPIVQSLRILEEQTENPKLRAIVNDLAKQVEGGKTLASALEAHQDIFPPVYINMVKAGETGGILDDVLERLAVQQEKDAEIISKVKGAMIYPGVITGATVAAFIFLMTVIVPKLSAIFSTLGGELPIYTKIMLGFSKFLTSYGWVLGIAAVIGVIVFKRWHQTPLGRRSVDRLIVKAPVVGVLIRKVNIARFARTFGSLMGSGISVIEALNTTSQALNNSVYKEAVAELSKQVKNGKTLAEPIKSMKAFPPIVAQMVSVGEETGQLDGLLLKLATFYEKEVDNVIDNVSSIIEPVLMIMLGVMVGSIVIAVFGPLSNLVNNI